MKKKFKNKSLKNRIANCQNNPNIYIFQYCIILIQKSLLYYVIFNYKIKYLT